MIVKRKLPVYDMAGNKSGYKSAEVKIVQVVVKTTRYDTDGFIEVFERDGKKWVGWLYLNINGIFIEPTFDDIPISNLQERILAGQRVFTNLDFVQTCLRDYPFTLKDKGWTVKRGLVSLWHGDKKDYTIYIEDEGGGHHSLTKEEEKKYNKIFKDKDDFVDRVLCGQTEFQIK